MQTILQQAFIPYTYQHVANDGEILILTFDTRADSEVLGNPRDCGQLITLNCKATGIENLTSAIVEWATSCGTKRIVSSESEDYELIVVTLTPEQDPTPSPVTSITITVKLLVSQTRNLFKLYAIIDGTKTLIAKGVIYTDIILNSVVEDATGGVEGDDEFVIGEVPSGLVNGSNATYTTAFAFVPESVAVFVNGVLQKNGVDYVTSGQYTIILTTSMDTGETILVDYIKG